MNPNVFIVPNMIGMSRERALVLQLLLHPSQVWYDSLDFLPWQLYKAYAKRSGRDGGRGLRRRRIQDLEYEGPRMQGDI